MFPTVTVVPTSLVIVRAGRLKPIGNQWASSVGVAVLKTTLLKPLKLLKLEKLLPDSCAQVSAHIEQHFILLRLRTVALT